MTEDVLELLAHLVDKSLVEVETQAERRGALPAARDHAAV